MSEDEEWKDKDKEIWIINQKKGQSTMMDLIKDLYERLKLKKDK